MKIHLFVIFLKYLEFLRIQSGKHRFNRRNIGILILFAKDFTSVSAYILYGANTIQDYEESSLWTLLCLVNIGFFTTIQRSPMIKLSRNVSLQ